MSKANSRPAPASSLDKVALYIRIGHSLRSCINQGEWLAGDHLATLLHCTPLSALVRLRTSRVDSKGKVVLCHDSDYRADKFVDEKEEEGVDLARSPDIMVSATRNLSPGHSRLK